MTTIYDTGGRMVPVWDTSGRLVWGEPTAPPAPVEVQVTPPTGPALNVATMCSVVNIGRPAAAGGAFAGTRHTITVDVDSPVLAWDVHPGFQGIDAGGTIRAAVTTPRETVEVRFGGQPSRTLATPVVGETITTDPVPVKVKAGETITVLSWIDTPGGQKVPADLTSTRPTDPGTGTGSWTTAPALTPRDGAGNLTGGIWSMRPSRIVAPTDRPSWAVIGDSIMQQSWTFGEMAVALLGHAASKAAQGGDAYLYQRTKPRPHLVNTLEQATHVIDEFGINDTGASAWDVIAADALKLWTWARARPHLKHIVKTTLTLGGGGKDRTDLDVSQTGSREMFNEWLRDGAPLAAGAPVAVGTTGATRCAVVRPDGTVIPATGGHPLSAVSDVVHVIESAPNSGKYSDAVLPLVGGDGLHPATGIHTVLATRLERDLRLLGF